MSDTIRAMILIALAFALAMTAGDYLAPNFSYQVTR